MYVVSFHSIFNENAVLLAQRLKIPYVAELNPKDGDVIIVFAAHEQADKLCFIQDVKKVHYIIIQTEQFPSKVFDNKYYMELIQRNSLLDWSRYNVERLKKHLDLKVFAFYFFEFVNPPADDWDKRPIDFFFCGAPTDSRKKILDRFKEDNPDARIEIDISYAHTSPPVMMEKLKNVKYVINLPFYEDNSLETHRINRALSAGCEVISTYSKDKFLNRNYEPYVHFVKELEDFTFLLEQDRKANYTGLMNDFGQKMVESNLRGIQNAAKAWLDKNGFDSSLPSTTSTSAPRSTATTSAPIPSAGASAGGADEEITDFKALLAKKKMKESMKKMTQDKEKDKEATQDKDKESTK